MELLEITSKELIPLEYIGTPVADLIEYQNFNREFEEYDSAQILVGMCMDNRKQLRIPHNFAYILRTGGANLVYKEFKISYAVAIGGVKYMVLIGHNNCGMVDLMSKKEAFVEGLCKHGGSKSEKAEEHFMFWVNDFDIENEIEFTYKETKRLSEIYKGITIVPLYYSLEDNMLSIIEE